MVPLEPDPPRLYGELAWLFPIITPLEHYLEESELLCRTIRELCPIPVRSVLHLGCGAGHNDFVLKRHFALTGIDRSEVMIESARKLNPEVDYRLADMRHLEGLEQLGLSDLEGRFQAVVCLDALDYLQSEDELIRTFRGVHRCLEPGGVFVFAVQDTRETYRHNHTTHWSKTQGEMEVTVIENSFDPEPRDTTYEYTLVYLIRNKGALQIETDRHLCGLFPEATFVCLLEESGFQASRRQWEPPEEAFEYTGDAQRRSWPLFVGIRSR